MLRRFSRPSVGIDSLPHIDAVLLTHAWDDPPERFAREADKCGLSIITPRLCETVCIDDKPQTERWWREYK